MTPTPNTPSREAIRAKLQKTADELNNTSEECLMAVSELAYMKLEDENDNLRAELTRLRNVPAAPNLSRLELGEVAYKAFAASMNQTVDGVNYPTADKTALVERVRERIKAKFEETGYLFDAQTDLLALCDLAESPDNWLPIESAPRDGTEIIGYRKDCGCLIIRWTAPIHFMTEAEIERSGMTADQAEEGDWFYADFISGGRMSNDGNPTHWQPRPTGPNVNKLD